MRWISQIIVSILVCEHVKAKATRHSYTDDVVRSNEQQQIVHNRRSSRFLMKGDMADENDGVDDYYEYDRHSNRDGKGKGKGKGEIHVPSVTQHPSSHPPMNVIDIYPITQTPQQQQEIEEEKSPPPPPPKKKYPDKKKESKSMNSKKISRSGKRKGKGKGKGSGSDRNDDDNNNDDDFGGKGKGKGGKGGDDDDDNDDDDNGDGGNMGPCSSDVARQIAKVVPEISTVNPISCCYSTTTLPVAVYVTHAVPSPYTRSGFEPFWDTIYTEIERTSRAQQVCFVMTGIRPDMVLSSVMDSDDNDPRRSIEQILFDVISFVSELSNVASIMTTDPTTENTNLMDEVRRIYSSNDTTQSLSSIGVFNAGYNNIVIESIIRNEGRLPYIGYLDDTEYGRMAGVVTLELLQLLNTTTTITPNPLCFNSRIGMINLLGDRCAAYYNELSSSSINLEPTIGVPCGGGSNSSTVIDIVQLINATGITRGTAINAVWAPFDCCTVVTDAVEVIVRQQQPQESNSNNNQQATTGIIIGCQDDDPTNGRIHFVTAQPIALQGYMAASWANFPVLQQQQQQHSERQQQQQNEQYFPSLQSLVHTAIYNTIIMDDAMSSHR